MRFNQLDPGQALRLWHGVCHRLVLEREKDLSLRQMAILLCVYIEPPPHTVRGLAEKLNVTKPVITRALDSLGRMKLVERRRDENDRRNVLVSRTVEGSQYLEELADIITSTVEEMQ